MTGLNLYVSGITSFNDTRNRNFENQRSKTFRKVLNFIINEKKKKEGKLCVV